MNLNKTDDSNYYKSCMALLHITWACIGLVIIADTVTIIIEATYLSTALFFTGFKSYVLLPGIINIIIMSIVHLLSRILLWSNRFVTQAILYVAGVTCICFVLAQANQDLVIMFVMFSVPILLAMLYMDVRIQVISLIFCLLGFGLHNLLLFRNDQNMTSDKLFSSNVEIALVTMVIVFTLSIVVIKRNDRLTSQIRDEIEKNKKDETSGYPNHIVFYEDLDEVFESGEKNNENFCLGLIDVDSFMLLNNKYGHSFGEEVINILVDSINKSLVNTADVYRYGGEEFAIICSAEEDIMINMVGTILGEFKKKTEMKLDVKVTASAGICEYNPKQFSSARDVFAAVGEALYAAKRLGKDQYAIWNDALVRNSYVGSGELVPEHIVEEVIEERLDA